MQKEKPKKTKWAHSVLIGVVVLIFVVLVSIAVLAQRRIYNLSVKGNKLHVEIATTSQEKRRGLCCRDSLAESAGMLFVYDTLGNYSFWMKDTRIPLDMIWIDQNKKVIHIEHTVQPSSYPESFSSSEPAQYILETNAGWAAKHDIQTGDQVQF